MISDFNPTHSLKSVLFFFFLNLSIAIHFHLFADHKPKSQIAFGSKVPYLASKKNLPKVFLQSIHLLPAFLIIVNQLE